MFLAFALITLGGAFGVLLNRSAVAAALCLVLAFFGVSGLFLLLGNPVAAALQILVYAGAITVLVLFVIMLLSAHAEEPPARRSRLQTWGGAAVALALGLGAAGLVLSSPALGKLQGSGTAPMSLERLGAAIFPGHLLAFEAVGVLLLAAMVAAVSIAKRSLGEGHDAR